MTDLDLASARIVSVRELNRDTARVLREVNEAQEPAVVTKHGRFVALITPLEGVPVEVHALKRFAQDVPDVVDVAPGRVDDSVPAEELRNFRPGR